LRQQPLSYLRRRVGRYYQPALVPPLLRPAKMGRVVLLCGDALDPPLVPQQFGRVVALNLLDSVRSPAQLLSVIDGLCQPGGEVLLGSPYSWQSGVVDEDGRLGGADPAAALRQLFTAGSGLDGPYTVEHEAELPWFLRRDARSVQSYLVHTLQLRKLG
jgi:SAM-dependent methyltransferase